MKNKLKKTMTALCAALILMGGFSVPAYAQGAATEPPAGDATNDSNVVVEEKEETPPLPSYVSYIPHKRGDRGGIYTGGQRQSAGDVDL